MGKTLSGENWNLGLNFEFLRGILKSWIVLVAMVSGVWVYGCKSVFATEGVVNAGYGVIGQSISLLRNAWPKTLQVLFKEQGLILAVLWVSLRFSLWLRLLSPLFGLGRYWISVHFVLS
ncbi:hypothetical protein L484_009518 [Morus notabilis]|uniref:Uncharacterized protein n=1 Tax=Morus notabilis TaxID=981085 RepID=W9R482_9ROSA|nr:hypothetical protein L484_009518 [Morus notabilis]